MPDAYPAVVLSDVREASIVETWSADSAHSVGKSVRWRPGQSTAAIFASCGSEGDVCVRDTREAGKKGPAVEFADAHTQGANFVAWSPAEEHLLASAGAGTELLLHDIRKAGNGAQALHTYTGHAQPRGHRCRQMYCPAFAAGGAVLVCPGENSERLSMYSVATGATLSRGCVGYDATALVGGGATRNAPLVAAAPGGALELFFVERAGEA